MIVYFADRQMRVLGHATTNLPDGYVIIEDLKTEEVESGVATFTCRIGFDELNRATLEAMTNAGNYLLRSHESETEFYTIIESEIDTKNQNIVVYAEDAGLDLLNEIAPEFEATEAHNAEWYINRYIVDSGFEIGINEMPSNDALKLSWDGESTVTARLASIATKFGGYEISFSFAIKGLEITNKYINFYAKRGKDEGVQLRLNKEIDRIVTTKSVANLATAFVCEGGIPDNAEEPITLSGYTYDDGDFFVDGDKLKSRKANEKWSRYVWNKEPNQISGYEGYIVRPYSYDTTDQKTLCSHAITELKKICDMEVNYEIDIKRLPEGVRIGDRINIIDDAGEMYVSTRVLLLETSIVDQKYTATLGEHLIKTSGISQKVAELAAKFAENAASAARALSIATTAKANATEAKEQAQTAAREATSAAGSASEALTAASNAEKAATDADAAAKAAEAAVDKVESSVSEMETIVSNAKAAAGNAAQAAETATAKAEEAATAAKNAQEDAAAAETAAGNAESAAESAVIKSAEAVTKADTAKDTAKSAIDTARAAKLDAEQAERDVASLGDKLETVTDTMKADYARKTELTETTAHLESQISKNAAGLSSTVSLLMTVDETANDARDKAAAAQAEAVAAQAKADEASADAEAAQTEARQAAQAATAAQAEADTAKAAAETAQSVADQAEEELEAAKLDLDTIQARADATEEEIAAARAAVNTAQAEANSAKAEADTAAQTAAEAQNSATTAAANAWKALNDANTAQANADLAQQLADKASSEYEAADAAATEAESKASQAKATATAAQEEADAAKATANTAVENAALAQSAAEEAVETATTAQKTAEEAVKTSAQAQSDLEIAETRLAEVMADVNATEEEIAAASAAVETAQAAASAAEAEAAAAQANAETAQANADEAQTAATEAEVAALHAQSSAEAAQDAADEAQAAVEGLSVRMTRAEANITQKAREITSSVKEVAKTTNAAVTNISILETTIRQLSDSISMLVRDENGESLMTQTSDGWVFSTKEIQDTINSTSSQLGELEKTAGETSKAVDILDAAVKDLGQLAEYIKIGTYTYTDENGVEQTEPSIDLGENDTGFRLKITNTRILFTDGASELVSINSKNKSLEIDKAEIKTELKMGGFVWQKRANGNMGLIWKGGNS